MGWFGSMALAWKYATIFGILLGVTLLAGFTKVLYDRNKLKKHTKEQELEAGRKEDQVELNTREKDEGDLFGVRAIEAGYFAGIPQSRPGSAAGSIAGTPSMSTNTLVGSFASPKIKTQSVSSSVSSFPLASANSRNSADPSSVLLSASSSPPNGKVPPTMKLRPSEAELNGRINHSPAVNMNLSVPPSPVLAQGSQSPVFSGSDSGESEGRQSPQSLSPHSPSFLSTDRVKPGHYVPAPPQLLTPEGSSVSVRTVATPENPAYTAKSATASMVSGQDVSPGHSAPPSPGPPSPEVRTPTMPSRALRDNPRSLFPVSEPRPLRTRKGSAQAEGEQPRE
ncbi:hypothetical protein AOQ84DRAFT_395493 [Glonium stellatum]|uniref:Uncharacterized protein n=1 Tax=Glonium stellatum TaxID=574774 RepID=A0A8E2FA73_9PEZI|nr:hypothetical protein AOQ84DRAFT_395493 [Glonium stellatum]